MAKITIKFKLVRFFMKSLSKLPILSAVLLFSLFSLIFALNINKNTENPVISPTEMTQADAKIGTVSMPVHNFVATIWNDSLVIFATSDMEDPYYISDISLYSLTNTDYEKLKDGIYLDTQEDISRLLEDFES